MERSLEVKEYSDKPRSASRGKKKTLKPQREGINFNFNWTKVNKLLTNPLLINKTVANGVQTTNRDSKPGAVIAGLMAGKNYLDHKKQILKVNHHKVKSMWISSGNNDIKAQESNIGRNRAAEFDLFSRKNSYGDIEKAALSQRNLRDKQYEHNPKTKLAPNTKKLSNQNLYNLSQAPKKKSVGLKRKKKLTSSGTGANLRQDKVIAASFLQSYADDAKESNRDLRSYAQSILEA